MFKSVIRVFKIFVWVSRSSHSVVLGRHLSVKTHHLEVLGRHVSVQTLSEGCSEASSGFPEASFRVVIWVFKRFFKSKALFGCSEASFGFGVPDIRYLAKLLLLPFSAISGHQQAPWRENRSGRTHHPGKLFSCFLVCRLCCF